MRKVRHLEPSELCNAYKKLAKNRQKANSAPYTGMSVACNYSLWKDWHFSTTKLAKYNQDINNHYEAIKQGFYTFEDVQRKVLEVSPGLDITTVYKGEDDLHYSDKFLRSLERIENETDNVLNKESVNYMRLFFYCLIDYGFDEKKLLKARKHVINRVKIYLEEEDRHIMQLHSELLEGTGIYIETPEE